MAVNTPPAKRITLYEIKSVIAAWHILAKWNLDRYSIADALCLMRAMYSLGKQGLREYLTATLGEVSQRPLGEFQLYDLRGQLMEIPVGQQQRPIGHYLIESFAQGDWPASVKHQGKVFYL